MSATLSGVDGLAGFDFKWLSHYNHLSLAMNHISPLSSLLGCFIKLEQAWAKLFRHIRSRRVPGSFRKHASQYSREFKRLFGGGPAAV